MKFIKLFSFLLIIYSFTVFNCDSPMHNPFNIDKTIEYNDLFGLWENYFGLYRYRFYDLDESEGEGIYYNRVSKTGDEKEDWREQEILFRKDDKKLTIKFIDSSEDDRVYFYKVLNKNKELYIGYERYEEVKDDDIFYISVWKLIKG